MSWSSVARLAPGVWAGLALVCVPALGLAQPAPAETVKFETFDQVELNGSWYPSAKGKKAAPILLLHAIGGNRKQEGWDALAKKLQAEGHAVLSFDFRGHGDSTTVGRGFWDQRLNQQYVKGYNIANPKPSIDRKDFHSIYYPMLVNDIVAARLLIERKNDSGDCNSANLMVIGAEEGGTLGAMWLASEWNRYIVTVADPISKIPVKWEQTPEGKKVLGVVFLSLSSSVQRTQTQVLTWLKNTGQDKKVPMAFLYGSQDAAAGTFAERCYNTVTSSGKIKLENTAYRGIRGTRNVGAALLKEGLGADDMIKAYVNNIQEAKGSADWKVSEVKKNGYVWIFNGSPAIAKSEGEESLRPLPVQRYGFALTVQ